MLPHRGSQAMLNGIYAKAQEVRTLDIQIAGKPRTDASRRLYWLGVVAVTVILCGPVLSVSHPPLVDYPNHLARTYILYHYHDSPIFQRNYQLHLVPIPNLAADAIVPLLLHKLDLLTAGRIFLLMTIVLFAAGCHQLGVSVHGKPTWVALPCAFFVYCSEFLWGFINFTFGLALFLFCIAFWLKWRPRWTPARLLVLTALVSSTYFAHLVPYGFVAVAVGTMTVWYFFKERANFRQVALDLLPLVPPLFVFAVYMRKSGSVGAISWGSLTEKLAAALSVVLTYDRRIDLLVIVGFAAIVLVLIRHRARIRVFQPLFAVGIVFTLLFAVLPYELFTGQGADMRFVPAAVLLLVSSFKLDLPERTAKGLLLGCLALSAARIASIGYSWRQLDQQTSGAIALLKTLPEGARVYPATCAHCENKMQYGLHHEILYATVYRQAFVPSLLALGSQEILLFRQPAKVEEAGAAGWTSLLTDYDFVWSYVIPDKAERDLEKTCALISREGDFALWRVPKAR